MDDVIAVALIALYFAVNVACAFGFDRMMGGKK